MRLRGIIFDLDGTLADTLPVCIAAFRTVLRTYMGRNYTDEEIRALFGPSEEGILQRLLPTEEWETGLDEFIRQYEFNHSLCAAPFAGIVSLLDLLCEHNVRVAIVTGKGSRSAEVSLRRLGLKGHFDTVATGSTEGSVKPEAIRKILTQWNISQSDAAESVLYVGDFPSDIDDAKRAGVIPIAAAWASSAEAGALEAHQPAFTFHSVKAFASWCQNLLKVEIVATQTN